MKHEKHQMHKHRTSKGPIHTHGSTAGGRDEHAHSSHHAMNKEHGTGFHPGDEDEYCGPSECAMPGKAHGRPGKQSSYHGQTGNEKHENDTSPKKAID